MTLPKSTVDAIIEAARESALQWAANGAHKADAAAWCEAEIRARIKGVENGWPEAKIQRRANLRYYARLAWRIGQKVPLRPFGGAGIAAGNLIEKTIRDLRFDLNV